MVDIRQYKEQGSLPFAAEAVPAVPSSTKDVLFVVLVLFAVPLSPLQFAFVPGFGLAPLVVRILPLERLFVLARVLLPGSRLDADRIERVFRYLLLDSRVEAF